jgi:hypothetical protein
VGSTSSFNFFFKKKRAKSNKRTKNIYETKWIIFYMQVPEMSTNKILCSCFGGTSKTMDKEEYFEANQLANMLSSSKVWLIRTCQERLIKSQIWWIRTEVAPLILQLFVTMSTSNLKSLSTMRCDNSSVYTFPTQHEEHHIFRYFEHNMLPTEHRSLE